MRWLRFQSCLKLLTEAFHQSIGNWMVRSGASKDLNSCELASFVSGDGWENSKTRDPASDECLGDSLCTDILDWNCLKPLGKALYTCEEVKVTIRRWKRSNDVNVDVVKSHIASGEGVQRGCSMAVDLFLLTLHTVAGPLPDISVDPWPNILVCKEMLTSWNTRVN